MESSAKGECRNLPAQEGLLLKNNTSGVLQGVLCVLLMLKSRKEKEAQNECKIGRRIS